MKRIAHISDIHFGEFTFENELKNNLLDQLEEKTLDLIVVAGDMTTNGYFHEYEEASIFLDEIDEIAEVYIVPGNHDSLNHGRVHFEELIGARKFITINPRDKLGLVGIDSTESDSHTGKIGIEQLEWLENKLKRIPENYCKIVTFHHHLLPIPQAGMERNILVDSGDLLRVMIDNGVDIVLNGHRHVPNAWMIEKIVVLNSGTATTRKLRGHAYPSYNQLIIEEDKIKANIINTRTGDSKKLVQYTVQNKEEEYTLV